MSGLLLDTNVISELRRPHPAPSVVQFIEAQAEDDLFISEVTFAEIRFGIEAVDDAERRSTLSVWLEHTLRPLFEGRVLPITEDVILRWRLMLERGRRRGHTFGQPDLFIAAIAAEEDLIVVTRDTIHFEAAGVAVLDPWKSRFTTSTGIAHEIDALDSEELLKTLTQLNGVRGEA